MTAKALSLGAGDRRRELLRSYLVAWLRDNVLSWSDLASPRVRERLLATLSSDISEVLVGLGWEGSEGLVEVGRELGAGAVRFVTGKVLGLAQGLGKGKKA